MPTVFLLIAALFIPTAPLAVADTITAGFPGQSVWLSKTDAVAGETIQIYAALYNAHGKTFKGTLVFFVDNERIAEKEFLLDAGAAALESALWKSAAGAHTARASIENASGVPIASISESSAAMAFAVTKKPDTYASTAVSEAVNVVSSSISTVVPYVQSAIETVHRNIEPYRESAITYLEETQRRQGERKVPSEDLVGTVDDTSTNAEENSAESAAQSAQNTYVKVAKNAFNKLSQVALAGALYAAKTPELFYALLLAAIVGILWSLFRWALRRPF